jgi:hypothetical protein
MANSVKKTSLSKNRVVPPSAEVDLDLLGALQFWWSRKIEYLVFTLLIILVAGSVLFIGQKLTNNSQLKYSQIVFTVSTTNSPISLQQIINPNLLAQLLSQESLQNLDQQSVLKNLSVEQFSPVVQDITNKILAFGDTDIKKLAISQEQIEETIIALNTLSQEYYTLRLIHNGLAITPAQSEILLNALIKAFNSKISNDIDLQNTKLYYLQPVTAGDLQNQNLIFEKLNAMRSNLKIIQEQYSELVTETDFSLLLSNLNRINEFLYNSDNTVEDEISIRIENQISEIDAKIASLYSVLNLIQNNPSASQSSSGAEAGTIAQINSDSIQNLLDLGKELSAVEVTAEIATEIKDLSFQKAELNSQLNLTTQLQNNYTFLQNPISIEDFNGSILQINQLIQKVIAERNPEEFLSISTPVIYYSDQQDFINLYIRNLTILVMVTMLTLILIYFIRFSLKQK